MTAIPLTIVVSMSMFKDILEDYGRRKQDNAENNAECEAAMRGDRKISHVRSLDIQVGCIVKVYNN